MLGQRVDEGTGLAVDQDGAVVVMALAQGDLIHPEYPGRGGRRIGQGHHQGQQGGPADRRWQSRGEPFSRAAGQGHPNRAQQLSQLRCPSPVAHTVSPSTCSAKVIRGHPGASQNRRRMVNSMHTRRPRRRRDSARIHCVAALTVFRSLGTAPAPTHGFWPQCVTARPRGSLAPPAPRPGAATPSAATSHTWRVSRQPRRSVTGAQKHDRLHGNLGRASVRPSSRPGPS